MPDEVDRGRAASLARNDLSLSNHTSASPALPAVLLDGEPILPELPAFLPDFRKVAQHDAVRLSYLCDVVYAQEHLIAVLAKRCASAAKRESSQFDAPSASSTLAQSSTDFDSRAASAERNTHSTCIPAVEPKKGSAPVAHSSTAAHTSLSELDTIVTEMMHKAVLNSGSSNPVPALLEATASPGAREAFARLLPNDSIFVLEMESQVDMEEFCSELVRDVVNNSADEYTRRCFDAIKEGYTALSVWDELRESVARSFLTQDMDEDTVSRCAASDDSAACRRTSCAVVSHASFRAPPRHGNFNLVPSEALLSIQLSPEELLKRAACGDGIGCTHRPTRSARVSSSARTENVGCAVDVPPARIEMDTHSRYVLNTLRANSSPRPHSLTAHDLHNNPNGSSGARPAEERGMRALASPWRMSDSQTADSRQSSSRRVNTSSIDPEFNTAKAPRRSRTAVEQATHAPLLRASTREFAQKGDVVDSPQHGAASPARRRRSLHSLQSAETAATSTARLQQRVATPSAAQPPPPPPHRHPHRHVTQVCQRAAGDAPMGNPSTDRHPNEEAGPSAHGHTRSNRSTAPVGTRRASQSIGCDDAPNAHMSNTLPGRRNSAPGCPPDAMQRNSMRSVLSHTLVMANQCDSALNSTTGGRQQSPQSPHGEKTNKPPRVHRGHVAHATGPSAPASHTIARRTLPKKATPAAAAEAVVGSGTRARSFQQTNVAPGQGTPRAGSKSGSLPTLAVSEAHAPTRLARGAA